MPCRGRNTAWHKRMDVNVGLFFRHGLGSGDGIGSSDVGGHHDTGLDLAGELRAELHAFAAAGAIVIFILAIEMLMGVELFKNDGPAGSATVVPIIFPLIAGAGTLTTLLSLRAEFRVENIVVAIILNMAVVYIVLSKLEWIERFLGKGVIFVLRKFFGIILLAMSVKLFVTNVANLFS